MNFWKTSFFAAAVALSAGSASAETLYGLTANNTIVTFDSNSPGTILATGAISGLGSNLLTGFDTRPANGVLYSVSTSGNLFSITPAGGAYVASLVGNVGVPFTGSGFGIDFNPTVDRLRFISGGGTNLRINPANAVTITDGAINGPGTISIVGSGYTNSVAGATTTALYALDSAGNQLLTTTNPNGGAYTEIGVLGGGVTLAGPVGFDISGGSGISYFSNGSQLYTLNLLTAATQSLGTVGSGLSLVGLTVAAVPEPSTWAMLIVGFGVVGGTLRRDNRSRRIAFA